MGKEEEVKLGLDQVSREMFVKWHPPPWSWNANPSWKVRISLSGGSSKRHSDKELLIDAINTITEVGTYEYAIYTDGSSERGFRNGGSAAFFRLLLQDWLLSQLSCTPHQEKETR